MLVKKDKLVKLSRSVRNTVPLSFLFLRGWGGCGGGGSFPFALFVSFLPLVTFLVGYKLSIKSEGINYFSNVTKYLDE